MRAALIVGCVISAIAGSGAWMQARATPARQAVAYDEIRDHALRSHRRIMLVFTREGCVPCARLEQETLSDPEVQRRIDAGWIVCPVDLDAPGAPEIAARHGVTTPPVIVLTTPSGEPLTGPDGADLRLEGLVPVDALTAMMDTRRERRTERHRAELAERTAENRRRRGG